MVCDNLNLPFRDQGFDAIISIGGKAARPQSHFALKSTVRPIISCDSMSILCRGLGNAFYLILNYIYIFQCMAYLTLDYIYGIYVVLILNLQAIIILFLMIYPPHPFFFNYVHEECQDSYSLKICFAILRSGQILLKQSRFFFQV